MSAVRGTGFAEVSWEEHMEVKVISWCEYMRVLRAHELRHGIRLDAPSYTAPSNESPGIRRRLAA